MTFDGQNGLPENPSDSTQDNSSNPVFQSLSNKKFFVFAIISLIIVIILIAGVALFLTLANNRKRLEDLNNVNLNNEQMIGFNIKRKADVDTLRKVLELYLKNNPGFFSELIPTSQKIAKSQFDICLRLLQKHNNVTYIAALPRDPALGGGSITDCNINYDTGYAVNKYGNIIIVSAPLTESGEVINSEIDFSTIISPVPSKSISPTRILNELTIFGTAMLPAFKNNQVWQITKYTNSLPLREDVIAFESPVSKENIFIKRIIGLPGELIQIKEGKVYINGKILTEPYLSSDVITNIFPDGFIKEGQTVEISANRYFVLGDNRNHSSDSREWGFIAKESIVGKLIQCSQNCN